MTNRSILVLILVALSLWVYAASPSGVWEGQLTMTTAQGETRRAARLELAVSGLKLTGTLTGGGTTAELLDGMVRGDEISFAIVSGASDIPRFEFHGRLDGDALTFAVTGQLKDSGRTLKLGEGSFKRRR